MHDAGENIDIKLKEWKVRYEELSEKASTKEVSKISSNLLVALDMLPKV